MDVAFLWVQDDVRSNRWRVRRVQREEKVADPGTKALRKSIIAKHSTTLGFVNMAEESVEYVLAAGHGDVLGPRFKANQGENKDKMSNCS